MAQKQELVDEVTSYYEYGLLPAPKDMPSLWSIRKGEKVQDKEEALYK